MRSFLMLFILAFTFPLLAANNNAAPASNSEKPVWTLFCRTFAGPGHMEQARSQKEKMLKTTGLKDWRVLSSEESSTLFYGYYSSIDDETDSKEAARAKKDRLAVSDIRDREGGQPIYKPFFITIQEADPLAKPEWDLKNTRGVWTLQIAAYLEDPQRKTSAVQSVINLRKEGIEAYYYHGPTISSICIGVFPESAATLNEGAKVGPKDDILVSTIPLPEKLRNLRDDQRVRAPDGKTYVVKQPTLIINDPTLKALKAKYPNHATDGVEGLEFKDKNGKAAIVYDSSFIVKIPQSANSVSSAPAIPKEITSQLGAGSSQPKPTAKPAQPSGNTPSNPPKIPNVNPNPPKPTGPKLPGIDF